MRAFRIAYDGTGYRGFQRQPHGDTVEDAVLEGLNELGVEFENGTPAGYAAAGRTDAGVSARAQTLAFEAPEWLTPRAFNGELPPDIRAWAAAAVAEAFHATHDAASRRYRYFLCARGADDGRAADACRQLTGRHDFHNLTPEATGTVRELTATVDREGSFLVVDCRAGGFARQLVRRLVSVVGAVARGRRELGFLDRVLGDEPLAGPDGVAPAPPEPLVLADVDYPGVAFEADADAVSSAREVFRQRRRERLAGARVAEALCPDDR